MISSIKICCNSKCPPIMGMANFVKVVCSDSIDNSYDILVLNKYSNNILDVFDKYSRIKCLICTNTIYFKNKKTINRNGYSLNEIVKEICDWIDKYPFITSNELYLKISGNSEKEINCPKENLKRNAAVVIGKDHEYIKRMKTFLKSDFCAVFDFNRNAFYDKNDKLYTDKIDELSIINSLPIPANKDVLAKRFEKFNKKFIGFFEHSSIPSHTFRGKNSSTPVTLIVGFAPEIGKFDVMCCLNRDFINNKIPVACFTGNALGTLFENMHYFDPTLCSSFGENVLNIRNQFFNVDNENLEMILIDVPGGCGNSEDIHTDYGGISFAHFRALNIDVVIFCVNDQIDKKIVLSECRIFEAMGAAKIIIVETYKHYLRNSIAEGKLSVYQETEILKRDFGKYACFDMDMVYNGKLFDYLYWLFTGSRGQNEIN